MLDAAHLLKTAVAIPSVSGQEAAVAEFLVSQLRPFADETFVDASGSVVAVIGHGPLSVYFLGHIDTVPGEIPVRLEDGLLYGRGAVDAKGAFCTAVAAASRLPDSLRERMSLRLIGATEEEAPSSKGARHAVTAYPRPDMVIIGEPSGWEAVTLGYKGRLVAKLHMQKPNFHSAGEGTTAAEDMVTLWQRLYEHAAAYNADISGVFDSLQVSLQAISGSSDGLYQTAEATVGYRLPPALTPEGLEAQLSALMPEVTMHFTGHEVAYRGEKDSPLARAFRVAIRMQQGRPRLKVKTGTSDMNVVAPHWQVPMLAYGPGDSTLDHTPDEHLDLVEYEKAIAVLTTALTELTKAYRPDNS